MYSATLLFIWAAILSHVSPWTLTLGVVVTLVVSFRLIAESGCFGRVTLTTVNMLARRKR